MAWERFAPSLKQYLQLGLHPSYKMTLWIFEAPLPHDYDDVNLAMPSKSDTQKISRTNYRKNLIMPVFAVLRGHKHQLLSFFYMGLFSHLVPHYTEIRVPHLTTHAPPPLWYIATRACRSASNSTQTSSIQSRLSLLSLILGDNRCLWLRFWRYHIDKIVLLCDH